MISFWCGNENNDLSSAKVHVFKIEEGKTVHAGRSIKATRSVPALTDEESSIGGMWRQFTTNCPDGQMFEVYAIVKRPMGFPKACRVVIRIRQQAALHRMRVKLPASGNSSLQELDITGRFDILTPDQAEAWGYTAKPIHKDLYDEEEREGLLEVKELEPAISTMDFNVERYENTETGEVDVVLVKKRVRRVRVRRKRKTRDPQP